MLLNATYCYSMPSNANQCFKANQLCFTGLDPPPPFVPPGLVPPAPFVLPGLVSPSPQPPYQPLGWSYEVGAELTAPAPPAGSSSSRLLVVEVIVLVVALGGGSITKY